MSITGLLNRATSKDTAVYWATPTPDGYGGLTFDAPVEIGCFWMDESNTMADNDGREVISNAKVFLVQDVDQSGMLYHGKLEDLTTAQKNDPRTLTGAYEIMRFTKKPNMKKTEFERVAYLRP